MEPSIEPRRGLSARHIIMIVVGLAVVGVLAFMVIVNGKTGTVETTSAGITKYMDRVKADSTHTIPITLLEGGDATHESEHIFQAFEALSGIESVTVAPDGASVIVAFASDHVDKEQIVSAAVEAGYAQP